MSTVIFYIFGSAIAYLFLRHKRRQDDYELQFNSPQSETLFYVFLWPVMLMLAFILVVDVIIDLINRKFPQ